MATYAWRKVGSIVGPVLLILTIVVVCFVILHSVSIPPQSETYNAMQMAKRRTLRFANTYNRFPSLTENLPLIDGYNNSIVDGWGRPLVVQINGEIVTLISYGRDGQPGGKDEDVDIVGSFRMKQSNGSWAKENCDWILFPGPVSG